MIIEADVSFDTFVYLAKKERTTVSEETFRIIYDYFEKIEDGYTIPNIEDVLGCVEEYETKQEALDVCGYKDEDELEEDYIILGGSTNCYVIMAK